MTPSTAPADRCPLYVDLDGTLTPTDTLYESMLLLVRRQPLDLLRLLAWLPLGKASFKRKLADTVRPDPTTLPYHQDLLRHLKTEHEQGRTLVLASAADARIVREVSDHLGLFDDVLGTQAQGPNLSRAHKREAIAAHARHLGHDGWAYAGNSRDDLAVWSGACEAVVVNAPPAVLARVRHQHPQARVFERQPLSLGTVLRAIRLKQWSKNALLFVPLLAAHSLDPAAWGAVLLAFLSFGLCASATYLVNDLLDLPADRVHRHKRHRPLAAGSIGIAPAVLLGVVMITLAFVLAGWVSTGFSVMLLLYTITTLGYSLLLKRLPLIDVLVLAALYTLRIGAGAVAAQVVPSNWLLAISMFLFMSLALVKRCAELEDLVAQSRAPAPGRGYQLCDLPTLRAMGVSAGFGAVMVLALYIDSEGGRTNYQQPEWLWAAVPLTLLWVMRMWLKTGQRKIHGEDPLQFALRDSFTWLMVLLIGGIGLLATIGMG